MAQKPCSQSAHSGFIATSEVIANLAYDRSPRIACRFHGSTLTGDRRASCLFGQVCQLLATAHGRGRLDAGGLVYLCSREQLSIEGFRGKRFLTLMWKANCLRE
jgi:hypothetical protein